MDKEEALSEFVKCLRTAFNNALAYPKNHPYFIKSTDELKLSIDSLLNFLNPLEIQITSKSIFIDGILQDKLLASIELARMLHSRRVEKIRISPGLAVNELAELLNTLTIPVKDIVKNGGLEAILREASVSHIYVESLDYSGLLNSQGQEDVGGRWRSFLSSIVSAGDSDKINEFADNFISSLKNINPAEVVTDENLRRDLIVFLRSLKKINKEKFYGCLNGLFNYLSGSSSGLSDNDLGAIKELFGTLDEEDFANILWSNLSKDNPPDPLFFSFFSTISEGAAVNKIADSLSSKIASGVQVKNDPYLIKKIQSLLLEPDSQNLSPVYRNTLSSLLKDMSTSEALYFYSQDLKVNYYFVLLNMLDKENNLLRERFILERLEKEVKTIFDNRDYEYIKYLKEVIKNKKKITPDTHAFSVLEHKISEFTEEAIWENGHNANLEYLMEAISGSCKGSEFYLGKIFDEGKVHAWGLSLFFRLFPAELGTFYSKLEANRDNLEFLSKIVKAACKLNSELSLLTLKQVYSFSSEIIKVEIIKVMQKMERFDPEFLLGSLKEGSRIIKKEALKALSRDKESIRKALRSLLEVPNFFGRKNNIILGNMSIIEELSLHESADMLIRFTKMRLFWYAPLRRKAQDILESLK